MLVPRASAKAPEAPKLPPEAPFNLSAAIARVSLEYGVEGKLLTRVIRCESQGNPKAIGDHGTSYGLVQIHMPAHPEITKEQAFDPEFAVDYLAKEISYGNGKIWSCY